MPPPLPPAPRFYLTAHQPLRPGAILLATVAAAAALSSVLYALGQTAHPPLPPGSETSRSAGAAPGSTQPATPKDDQDDPNQVDTIAVGDPADAPVPARRGDHVSPVHPTLLVHLPRFGEQSGLIPDTPAGRLLYAWLAAFNHASYPELANALPTLALSSTAAAQVDLRQQTGGFTLLSAKEVQPGVLVFRLRDQSPTSPTEALGTLQLRPDSKPPAIASFSLRAVPRPQQAPAAPQPVAAPTQ